MKTKKIRPVKITLYIENIPAFKNKKELDKDDIAKYIEDILRKKGLSFDAPSDVLLGEIETVTIPEKTPEEIEMEENTKILDAISKGKKIDPLYEWKDDVVLVPSFNDCKKRGGMPVGFLSPDGHWYLLNTQDDGLAHLTLASAIHNLKTKEGFTFPFYADGGIDFTLEANGFVKVHGYDIRYLAHFQRWNIEQQKSGYTPDLTQMQITELCKYMRRLSILENDKNEQCCINDHKWVKRSELLQMEPLMIRQLFSLH